MLSLNLIIGPLGANQPGKTHEMEAHAHEIARNTRVPDRSIIRPPTRQSSADIWLTMEATAYVALCDTGCTGITATGIDVRGASTYEGKRIIAVDPTVVPLWSEVELRHADGNTERAIALDTGGAIVGNRIDLLVAEESTAWAFGRQPVELRILN